MRYKHKQKGFTLIEVLLSVVIVGIGITALMLLMSSGTMANKYGNDLAASVFLADQIRTMTDEEPFEVLTSYDGTSYDGVDALGETLEGMERYKQIITAKYVDPYDMNVYVGSDPQAVLLTSKVQHGGKTITELSWLRIK